MGAQKLILLSLIGMLVILNDPAAAEIQKIIAEKNDYGGKTIEVTFKSGDKLYGDALKGILSFDRNGKKIKEEYFSSDTYAKEKGIHKKTALFDSNGKM
jgi:hypothetical protein